LKKVTNYPRRQILHLVSGHKKIREYKSPAKCLDVWTCLVSED